MNIEEFKSNFEGETTKKLIEFIWEKEDVLYEDVINLGIFNRLSNNKYPGAAMWKKFIKYLNKIGAVSINGDRIVVNKDFIPNSQK